MPYHIFYKGEYKGMKTGQPSRMVSDNTYILWDQTDAAKLDNRKWWRKHPKQWQAIDEHQVPKDLRMKCLVLNIPT